MTYIPPFRKTMLRLCAALAVLVVLGYGLFEARRLIEGPQLSITYPRDGQALAGPLIHIKGTAENAAFFTINGGQAFVDQHGNFDENLSPPPGYTVLTISAKDRFGRMAQETVHLTINNYCPAYAQG